MYLALHGVRVDLAHVGPLILALHVADVEGPGVDVVVGDGEASVVRDDVLVDGQDRLGVRLDPRHLRIQHTRDDNATHRQKASTDNSDPVKFHAGCWELTCPALRKKLS